MSSTISFDPSFIDAGLWIGPRSAITMKNFLNEYKIRQVISVQTKKEVQDFNLKHHISDSGGDDRFWLWIPADDTCEEELFRHFELVHQTIEEARVKGYSVYIHCAEGISRSPTIAAAHLMLKNGWTRRKALEHILKHRLCIEPNDGFMNQLKSLEVKLDIEGRLAKK